MADMDDFAGLAPLLRLQKVEPGAKVFYDMLSDALIWDDETSESISEQEGWSVIRYVWHDRTRLILGETTMKYPEFWRAARELFPTWIGFLPERCSPDPELAKLYTESARRSTKCLERMERACDRLERMKNRQSGTAGDGGGA